MIWRLVSSESASEKVGHGEIVDPPHEESFRPPFVACNEGFPSLAILMAQNKLKNNFAITKSIRSATCIMSLPRQPHAYVAFILSPYNLTLAKPSTGAVPSIVLARNRVPPTIFHQLIIIIILL